MSASRTIEVTIEVEVFYQKAVDKSYGADADDRGGYEAIELVPTTCQVLTRVPKAVEEWAKMQALDLFNERYN